MKKLLFVSLSAAALLISCTKCVNCTKGSSSEKLCESNYSSSTTYEADVNIKETQGYTCTAE